MGVNPREKSGHKRPQDKPTDPKSLTAYEQHRKIKRGECWGYRSFQSSPGQTHISATTVARLTSSAMEELSKSSFVLRLLCVSITLKHLDNKGETPKHDF